MSELPKGWATCTLGDVIRIQNGYAFPSTDFRSEGVPLIRQSNLCGDRISLDKCVFLDSDYLQTKPDFILRKNDVLIGMSGSVGKLCIYDLDYPALQNQRTGKVVPLSQHHISRRFIWEFLKTVEAQLQLKGKGLGVVNISAKDIETLPLTLPPLNEQRHIAAKLEQLFSRVDACQKQLGQIPRLLKQFRQSTLAAAYSGRLSADWRQLKKEMETATTLLERIRNDRRRHWEEEALAKMREKGKEPLGDGWKAKYVAPEPASLTELPPLPESWCWASAAEIVEPGADIVYGIVQPGPEVEDGVPYVRGLDIQNGRIREDQLRRTHPSIAAQYTRAALRGGDVLLGIIRATKVAIIPDSLNGANITQGTARFRPAKGILTEYLAGWLQSADAQKRLHEMYRGIDMPGLNLKDVRRLPVPLAPLAEQEEIAKRIKRLLKIADVVEDCHIKAMQQLEKLPQSILAKAFRGELVPQDPNDEPASALLERIRAERVGTVKPERKAKRQSAIKSKTAAGPSTLF